MSVTHTPSSKFVLALAASLALSACAASSGSSSPPPAEPAPPPPRAAVPAPAARAPVDSPKAGGGDPMLQRRAAQTLGVPMQQVAISNIDREGGMAGRVNFTASVGRASYGCYVTSGIGGTSDAICVKPRGGGMVNNGNNPLINEANKLNKK